MNYRRLPPLQSLIAFEAAARLLSFKDAANELFLSPPAVTYRIKELEALLDLKLFIRTPKGLELTAPGRKYYKEIEKSLRSIHEATQAAQELNDRRQLRVQMLPFLATEIVIPELSDFYQKHPDIDIQIDTKYALADFQREEVDVVIRFGLGDWDGLESKQIMPASVSLVCSPHYAVSHEINNIDDLSKATLVTLANEKYNWELFAKQTGIEATQPMRELHFNDYTLCLRAAEQDMGITFGILPLSKQWIDAKRLVPAFPLSHQLPQAYYFCHKPDNKKSKQINAFYDWLINILPCND